MLHQLSDEKQKYFDGEQILRKIVLNLKTKNKIR